MKIICECGVNFRDLDEAFEMIREAKRINAFLCKFQLYNEENLKDVKDLNVRKFLRSIMLDFNKAKELFEYGQSIGQTVFFTPMYDCIDFLEGLGVKYYKIRNKDLFNFQLVKKIANTGKTYFLSNNNLERDIFYLNRKETFHRLDLYCIPKYPAIPSQYKKYFNINLNNGCRDPFFVGFSDHTKGFKLLKQAIFHQIPYFEKHVMLSETNPIERDWSVTFEQLAKVLQNKP